MHRNSFGNMEKTYGLRTSLTKMQSKQGTCWIKFFPSLWYWHWPCTISSTQYTFGTRHSQDYPVNWLEGHRVSSASGFHLKTAEVTNPNKSKLSAAQVYGWWSSTWPCTFNPALQNAVFGRFGNRNPMHATNLHQPLLGILVKCIMPFWKSFISCHANNLLMLG